MGNLTGVLDLPGIAGRWRCSLNGEPCLGKWGSRIPSPWKATGLCLGYSWHLWGRDIYIVSQLGFCNSQKKKKKKNIQKLHHHRWGWSFEHMMCDMFIPAMLVPIKSLSGTGVFFRSFLPPRMQSEALVTTYATLMHIQKNDRLMILSNQPLGARYTTACHVWRWNSTCVEQRMYSWCEASFPGNTFG